MSSLLLLLLIPEYYDLRFCKDGAEAKEKLAAEFVDKALPAFLMTSEALLEKRGGKAFTGKEVGRTTWKSRHDQPILSDGGLQLPSAAAASLWNQNKFSNNPAAARRWRPYSHARECSSSGLLPRGQKHETTSDSYLQLSYGDIAVFMCLDLLTNGNEMEGAGFSADRVAQVRGKIEACPKLRALADVVGKHPKISAYLEVRPDYPF